jgi:hypothetical protein
MKSHLLRSAANGKIHSLDHSLRLYSIAAGAAGMSMLALQCPANAEIVFTPTHALITTKGQFTIDFNHDGIADFVLVNGTSFETNASCSFCGQHLKVSGNGNAGAGVIARKVGPGNDAIALTAGAIIGPADPFLDAQNTPALMASGFNDDNSFFNIYGKFSNTKGRFLGLKFEINGQTHFGWVRLGNIVVKENGSVPFVTAVVGGYAYETVPNKPITAGATHDSEARLDQNDPVGFSTAQRSGATLGMLAGGAPALALWRREESAGEVLL